MYQYIEQQNMLCYAVTLFSRVYIR